LLVLSLAFWCTDYAHDSPASAVRPLSFAEVEEPFFGHAIHDADFSFDVVAFPDFFGSITAAALPFLDSSGLSPFCAPVFQLGLPPLSVLNGARS